MDILEEIKRLKSEKEQLQKDLIELRDSMQGIQDAIILNTLKKQESKTIDKIDSIDKQIEELEADLPIKRTNGHHKAESEEDEKLDPDFKPNKDDDRKN